MVTIERGSSSYMGGVNLRTESVALLLLERGAVWPSWSRELRDSAPHLVVETQLEDETLARFEERLLERLQRMRLTGIRLGVAAYACSVSDDSGTATRVSIGQTLLGMLEPGAQLILAGSVSTLGRGDTAQKARVMELWTRLCEGEGGREVRVRFEALAPSQSGVFESTGGLEEEATEALALYS